MWNLLKDCVGKDLSRVALPVYFNEPTSFLQRLAEDYQYAALLERVSERVLTRSCVSDILCDIQAAMATDPMERLLWVTVYTMTPFASAVGRTYKPFNPLLGETYELIHRGYKFHSEQVGHHPPTSAYHTIGKGFTAFGHLVVSQRSSQRCPSALRSTPSLRVTLLKSDWWVHVILLCLIRKVIEVINVSSSPASRPLQSITRSRKQR